MVAPASTSPAPSVRRWLALAIACFVLAPAAALLAVRELASRPPPLPVLAQLPDFALTNQRGEPDGLAKLRGSVWVADFVFTRCPSICPTLTAKMARLEEKTAKLGSRLQLVSISVDPAYDTPPVLTRYMQAHRADASRWRFLTGPTDAIAKVVTDGFKEVLERDTSKPDDFMSIVHGGHFVLVDREGRIRGYYDVNEPGALDAIARDAQRLVDE